MSERMTPEQITDHVRLHGMWLRNEEGGVRADLRRAVLRRADLSGADLSGAVLSGADLRRADLRGAVLSGADLSGADLVIVQADRYMAYVQRDAITIGCQRHTMAEWLAMTDEQIVGFGGNVEAWHRYRPLIEAAHAARPGR